MFHRFRLPVFIVSGVLVLVLVLVFGSYALAQSGSLVGQGRGEEQGISSPAIPPVPGGPGFISLHPSAFIPADSDQLYSFVLLRLYNPGYNSAIYYAPVQLPNRATVTKFIVYYYDNEYILALNTYLLKTPLDGAYHTVMAAVNSVDAFDGVRYAESSFITDPVIDQQANSYMIMLELPATMNVQLAGVRVDYSYSVQMPLINK